MCLCGIENQIWCIYFALNENIILNVYSSRYLRELIFLSTILQTDVIIAWPFIVYRNEWDLTETLVNENHTVKEKVVRETDRVLLSTLNKTFGILNFSCNLLDSVKRQYQFEPVGRRCSEWRWNGGVARGPGGGWGWLRPRTVRRGCIPSAFRASSAAPLRKYASRRNVT